MKRIPHAVPFLVSAFLLGLATQRSPAFRSPDRPMLPNFDLRSESAPVAPSAVQQTAADQLRARLTLVRVDFDPLTAGPRISGRGEFLSGRNGVGKTVSAAAVAAFALDDPHRAAKAFLQEHTLLFGFGPEILSQARISREFVTAHNGMATVVWEQQLDGVPVFEAVLIAHTTSAGELVSLVSQFVPDVAAAADHSVGNRAALLAAPGISAANAVLIAAGNLGEKMPPEGVVPEPGNPTASLASDAEQRQQFRAPALSGVTEARLVWLPVRPDRLRLCWAVVLTSRARGEMFRVLVDAQNGEVMVRHGLTAYLSDVTYRVYTNDSPSPFSPGLATPGTTQPAVVARNLVITPALDTNASPAGWIDDGGNETRGNNVDAHTDRNNDNLPDLPRPQGSPFRVFDFDLNLAQDPTQYGSAAVVQLFYLCNWMHDKLYELGFTEAAGNFQSNNFARGGAGNDAVQADAQDGGGFNNANMSTFVDGNAPRLQMYIWNGPTPHRDGDLDAEVVLHEYTHGLSNRRVGGGVGITALQPSGMGEGWSDFYALSLLSQAGDDVNGNYPLGGYATYKSGGSYQQNYYFGIRRFPCTTDLAKNPLTFRDLDPAQAHYCSAGAPYNTGFFGGCNYSDAAEVHNQGELWCVTLWEARANLVNKYGWAVGNQKILQLVTDGMNLSPPNPTFLQARDGIITADAVNNGGANWPELWAAFAKRGMGLWATSPANSTTTGVHESFEAPPPRVLFFALDTDPGWAREGQWAFGRPAGSGGAAHGHPDPATGFTGTNVFGINLNGDYSSAVGGPYSLTAGPFNFSGITGIRLQFERWLNSDYPTWVYATVDISPNGTNWSSVWTNPISPTLDAAWTRVAYDVSPLDNQTNAYVRWTHRIGRTGPLLYSGWNIDDVEFLGYATMVTAPDHFTWSHIPSPQVANVPFLASVQARNSTNGLLANFSGTVSLSATNGAVAIAPAVSANFVQGVWTGAVTVAEPASNLVLRADDGAGHTGLTELISFVAAPTLALAFNSTNPTLTWPAGAPALILESSDNLSPAVWLPVGVPPVQIGDQFVLQIGVSSPQRFYRLRYTPP